MLKNNEEIIKQKEKIQLEKEREIALLQSNTDSKTKELLKNKDDLIKQRETEIISKNIELKKKQDELNYVKSEKEKEIKNIIG